MMVLDVRVRSVADELHDHLETLYGAKQALFTVCLKADNARSLNPSKSAQAIHQAIIRARLYLDHALYAAREAEDEAVRANCRLPPSGQLPGWYARRVGADPLPSDGCDPS